ncbi:MAG: dual specificity protein phosphatase family protein [Gemmataceae bacterium]|nr:dual specificity protein phosphatase family protein [Gemmataceae bacterium]
MRRRRWVWVLVLAVPSAAALSLAWADDHHLRNFRAVEPGVLYRSGQLTPTGMKYALRRHGIRTVVTLRTVRDPGKPYPDEWEADVCAAHGARHVRLVPRAWLVDETGELPAEQLVREFLAVMDDPANHPVLVHSFAGVHRTGTMCAIFRREYQGWPADRAIEEMDGFGFRPGPIRDAIEDYLRAYRPRR